MAANWLDQSIAWLSPQAALQRARARSALAMATRAYEGSKTSRRTQGWVAGGTSANAEISTAGARLRNRSRDLVRNDPYARRAIAALVANAIGTGITADSESPAGKVWKDWVKECDFYGELDFYGLQALVARCLFESGECLIVRVNTTAESAGKSGVPLKLKVYEPDMLDASKHGPVVDGGGNQMFSGIEVDSEGRRVAYHLWLQHPGDQAVYKPVMKSVRVLAVNVIHVFEKERPGQLRGVPRLSSVILALRDLNEYNEALLVKKKIEACFAAFVTSDEENRVITPGSNAESGTNADGSSYSRRIETLSPGMIEYLKPGETVEFGGPSSTAGVGEFEAGHQRAVAMGAGLTYEILTGDLSRVNFSSMRAGRQEFKSLIEQFRWLVFVPTFCERVQDWFEEAAYTSGRVRTRGYEFTWTPPRWEYVNPLDDVKTDTNELAAGLSSWSSQVRKRGEDPKKVLAEIAADKKAFEDAGVDITFGDPAKPAPAAPAEPADDGDGPAPDAGPATKPAATPAARSMTIEDVRHEIEHARGAGSVPPQPIINITNNVPERETKVENHIAPAAVHVAPPVVHVAPAEVRVDVQSYPTKTVETILRDENGEIASITRSAED